MADFSKQWCDRYDPGGLEPDFDIEEVFNDLTEGYYTSIICEGYGFTAIAKINGKCMVFIPDYDCAPEDNTQSGNFVDYEEFITNFKY
jgi:hypothetical protein